MQFSSFARKAVLFSMVQLFALVANPGINNNLIIQPAFAQEVINQDGAEQPETPEVQAPPPAPFIDSQELNCLAENIYYEARGEPKLGQIAVAHVTINRAHSGLYPNTICGVVHQQWHHICQFTWACNSARPRKNLRLYNDMLLIAERALTYDEFDPSYGALYFERSGRHYFHRRVLVRIGHHVFYGNGKTTHNVENKQNQKFC